MDKKGLVSIIITVYNSEEYLSLPLNSILKQTCKDFEVVIVDDGSTDNSENIIQDFIEENPQLDTSYLKMEENKGQAAALNLGMKLAKGEFLCMIDSDDEISPYFVQRLKNKIEDSLDFVYCGFDTIYPSENRVIKYIENRHYEDDSEKIIQEYMRSKNHFSYVGAIYRKSFLEEHQIAFYESNRCGYDIEFICNLFLKKPRCGCVHESLYFYIRRPHSITMTKESPYAFHPVDGMERVQKKIPLLTERIKFAFSKKSHVIFYIIQDLYRKKCRKRLPISKKMYYTFYFLFELIRKPKLNMKTQHFKAIVFFNG